MPSPERAQGRFWLIGSVLGLSRYAENGKWDDALKKPCGWLEKKREIDAEDASCT